MNNLDGKMSKELKVFKQNQRAMTIEVIDSCPRENGFDREQHNLQSGKKKCED